MDPKYLTDKSGIKVRTKEVTAVSDKPMMLTGQEWKNQNASTMKSGA